MVSRHNIPIIDFGFEDSIRSLTKPQTKEIATQLNNALSTNGFVFLINHGIAEDKLQSVYKIMDTFLDLTDDVKGKYKMNPPEQIQGYISLGMEKLKDGGEMEIKHSYNIVRLSEMLPRKEIPNFQEVIGDVIEEFINLANLILKLIAEAQGLDPDVLLNFHNGMMKEDNLTALRMLYYPPLGKDPPSNITRCGEHSDWGTFTLLTQDGEGGLEVFQEGEWRRIGHIPGAIIMNVGDIMEVWTSSKYKSARHRVVVPEDPNLRTKGRHSTAFFVMPDITTLVDPSVFTSHQSAHQVDSDSRGSQVKILTAFEYLQQKRIKAFEKSNIS